MSGFGQLPKQQWKEWKRSLFEQRGLTPWIISDFGKDSEEFDHFNVKQMADREEIDHEIALSRLIRAKVYTFIDVLGPRVNFELHFNGKANTKEYKISVFLGNKGEIRDVVTSEEWNSGANAQSIWSLQGKPSANTVDWIIKATSILAKRCYDLHKQAQIDGDPDKNPTNGRS